MHVHYYDIITYLCSLKYNLLKFGENVLSKVQSREEREPQSVWHEWSLSVAVIPDQNTEVDLVCKHCSVILFPVIDIFGVEVQHLHHSELKWFQIKKKKAEGDVVRRSMLHLPKC